MSLPVSRRVQRVQASATVEINALALQRRSAGEDVISLAAGEPDFDTPTHVCDAAVEAIRSGKTHYTPLAGVPELRDAISAKFQRDNGFAVEPSDVVVSNG
ncbi:MAG: aminotransferase class I/II-fold pyridoxal phosphate-dependent enzyme, partial [Pseudomonadota bacterium]